MGSYHLAQCNIAKLRAPLDSPLIADFVAALEPVNEVADRAPGFVWRLQTEDGDATAIRAFEDDMLIVNISVWETIDALASFTFSGLHLEVMRRRRHWFERISESYLVLWWIPAGTIPTVEEARRRLELLRIAGPGPDAFTFRARFDATGAPILTHSREADEGRCPT